MRRRTHCCKFTWKGESVTGRELAGILGCSHTRLYDRAIECGSDRGEDILLILDRPRPCKKKRIWWDDVFTLVLDVANELGIKEKTLLSRLNTYGPDCYLCYFLGRIPKRLTPAKKRDGYDPVWGGLGNRARSIGLSSVQSVGTWEARQ